MWFVADFKLFSKQLQKRRKILKYIFKIIFSCVSCFLWIFIWAYNFFLLAYLKTPVRRYIFCFFGTRHFDYRSNSNYKDSNSFLYFNHLSMGRCFFRMISVRGTVCWSARFCSPVFASLLLPYIVEVSFTTLSMWVSEKSSMDQSENGNSWGGIR